MAYGDSLMEWIDGNLGSKLTMKYPAIYLMEPGARGETLSIALRRRRPAPGRRGQDGPLRSAHVEPHHLEVDLARTAAAQATAVW